MKQPACSSTIGGCGGQHGHAEARAAWSFETNTNRTLMVKTVTQSEYLMEKCQAW